ncbi:MAG: DNA mismatch repair protein MutS, partial [Chloroflexi bacterium]|nr:DNA mismatch repair protein MutS [Chloroflexota bacterium]
TPFFSTPLSDIATIQYRQAVMQDLEDETLAASIRAFADKIQVVRRYLKMLKGLSFEHHRKGWFLEAALVYTAALSDLQADLGQADLRSRGLLRFRDDLSAHLGSAAFRSLAAEARGVKAALASLTYCLIIQHGQFSVRRCEGEPDYAVEVERTFAKFQEGKGKDYSFQLSDRAGMTHIEGIILDFVTRLHPDEFAALDRFCDAHGQFVNDAILTFDREAQFYIAFLEFVAPLKRQGLPLCYPQVSLSSQEVFVREGFDLALAQAQLGRGEPMVPNDFCLHEPERVLVVTGPNQGGKTTFARMFGQLHYLASLGCPVPGRCARLALFDQIFTHFEREEEIRNLQGRLQDDLVRIHKILGQATSRSILILNELFSSTSLQDAVYLSEKIMAMVLERDCLCVWVTFLDELSRWSEKTVSMVSTVDPLNPAQRTFAIVRKPADGLAYALSLAEKHGVTYRQIKERIQP